MGVWLQPEDLSNIVIDEAEVLRKRIQLNELLVFEITYVTSHPAPPFSKAIAAAQEVISPDQDGSFSSAIDITRARVHRINPLGRKSDGLAKDGDTSGEARVEIALEVAPALPDFDDGIDEETAPPETPAGRLERWQRKLLDLSARNPLLNIDQRKRVSVSFVQSRDYWRTNSLTEPASQFILSPSQPRSVKTRNFTGNVLAKSLRRSTHGMRLGKDKSWLTFPKKSYPAELSQSTEGRRQRCKKEAQILYTLPWGSYCGNTTRKSNGDSAHRSSFCRSH